MDVDWTALVANAPNLIIAVWVIWKGAHLVERLLDTQRWMVEQLMALHPPQDEAHQIPDGGKPSEQK